LEVTSKHLCRGLLNLFPHCLLLPALRGSSQSESILLFHETPLGRPEVVVQLPIGMGFAYSFA